MATLNDLIGARKITKTKKTDRPTVDVPRDALISFKRLVGAHSILEVAKSRQDAEESIVNEIMLDSFINSLWLNGFVPTNPKLLVEKNDRPDMTGIFQVQQRYKVTIDKGDNTPKDRLIEALQASGLNEENAQRLVENEVDAEPIILLRPFNELVNGHYEQKEFVPATEKEQAVGQKLLNFVMGNESIPLSDEEKDLVVRREDRFKVKDGFLQRLKTYCNSKAELSGVLHVIVPVHFVSHMKFGISDTPETRQTRLVDEAAKLLGVESQSKAA